MVACPNGHQSNDPQWCDTCGAKLDGPSEPFNASHMPSAVDPVGNSSGGPVADPTADPTDGAPVGTSAPLACPHCSAGNPLDSLFCEQCGYDFTTGQTPPPEAPIADTPSAAMIGDVKWVVIVEVDPAWFAMKGALADQPCPTVSSSTVALAQHVALVGRTSQSRAIRPEIALDNDTGVSRRHAQFIRDVDDVTVVDLSSTNGTYVVLAGTAPDDDAPPLDPGVPVALGDGDMVYVGAWSRLTLRRG